MNDMIWHSTTSDFMSQRRRLLEMHYYLHLINIACISTHFTDPMFTLNHSQDDGTLTECRTVLHKVFLSFDFSLR